MNKVREVVAYKNYFEDFLKKQNTKVQNKIFKVIEAIETLERVPERYLKHLTGTDGLYEARIQLGSNIWRVFCFFDKGQLVILLNGFQKKTSNALTPPSKSLTLWALRNFFHELLDRKTPVLYDPLFKGTLMPQQEATRHLRGIQNH